MPHRPIAARFRRGGVRWCVHQAAVDWHDHDDRVGQFASRDRRYRQTQLRLVRRDREEITMFKSVGVALQDLAAAELVVGEAG